VLAHNRWTVDNVIGPVLESGHGEDAEWAGRSAWRAQTLPAAAAKHALEVTDPLLQLQELINGELHDRIGSDGNYLFGRIKLGITNCSTIFTAHTQALALKPSTKWNKCLLQK